MREYWIVYDTATGAERWRGSGAPGQAALEQFEDGLALLVVPAAALAGPTVDLAAVRAGINAQIDAAAERVRARFVSNTPGQMQTYIEKEAEAHRVLLDPAASTTFLALEAEALGLAVQDLAAQVLTQASNWRQLAAHIEAARRAAKIRVLTADNYAALAAACRIDWAAVTALASAAD